jgi:hypothetical protein
MPIYQNETSDTITVQGKSGSVTFTPNQTIKVDFFVPDEEGLTLVNENPRVEPQTLVAGTLELYNGDNERIYIPKCKEFGATMMCKFGNAVIRESYKDAGITTPLNANAYLAKYRRPDVEALWVEGKGDDVDGPTLVMYHVSRLS